MTNKTLLMLLLVLAAGIGLGGAIQLRYELLGHNEVAPPADDPHAGHDHSEGASQVTVWTDQFEIFLEYPPIMVGTPTAFVTHVSNLVTGEPRRTGPVTFVLSQGTSKAQHIDPAPARTGIYIPELTFPLAGKWNVSLVVPYNGKDNVIALPPVQVYSTDAEIHNAPAPEVIEGLSFLKEQQWKLKTETEVVDLKQISGVQTVAIPQSAVIEEGDQHIAFVQLAGETFAERIVTLGSKADGFVQVLSGVSQGERVVTKGAEAVDQAVHSDAAHAHEGEAPSVSLTDDEIARYGIALATAGPGNLDVHVSLPGQIAINTDRLAHIVPTAAGVVRQVISNVGDKVKAGDVLAWIESPELGKAKVDYLTKWAELGCCAMDLKRTRQIYQSTTKLLETLQTEPPLETLNQIAGEALDINHTTLVSAYAELSLAKAAYLREKPLKEISSKQDFLTAESDLKKAEAKYAAARDSITFQIQKTLIDAERNQQVLEIGAKGAERTLYVLGLKAEDVNDVRLLAQGLSPILDHAHAKVCTNPNCTECKKAFSPRGDKEKLAWYPLRAPFDGTVIKKHITLGEKLTGESDAYTVADINSVWVNLNVHQKHLPQIALGQRVLVDAGPAAGKTEGRISYVSPVVGQSSRTTLARIVLENKLGLLRPGTFVTADVAVDQVPARVAVPKDIIQDMDDHKTVFVRTGNGFEARAVNLGKSNTVLVEITSGLEPGETIVTKNSFRLKAELEKDAGGENAGHGHAH